MKTVVNDVVTFIRKFWTIVTKFVKDTFIKYKFKNALMLGIALYFWFLLSGELWAKLGWITFWIWVGTNVEGLLAVYRELKKEFGW